MGYQRGRVGGVGPLAERVQSSQLLSKLKRPFHFSLGMKKMGMTDLGKSKYDFC